MLEVSMRQLPLRDSRSDTAICTCITLMKRERAAWFWAAILASDEGAIARNNWTMRQNLRPRAIRRCKHCRNFWNVHLYQSKAHAPLPHQSRISSGWARRFRKNVAYVAIDSAFALSHHRISRWSGTFREVCSIVCDQKESIFCWFKKTRMGCWLSSWGLR